MLARFGAFVRIQPAIAIGIEGVDEFSILLAGAAGRPESRAAKATASAPSRAVPFELRAHPFPLRLAEPAVAIRVKFLHDASAEIFGRRALGLRLQSDPTAEEEENGPGSESPGNGGDV